MLDGAWGVLIHRRGFSEERVPRRALPRHTHDVKGDPDLLNLTAPEVVAEIHDAILRGRRRHRDTNTFTATSIGQADYALQGAVGRDEPRGRAPRAPPPSLDRTNA